MSKLSVVIPVYFNEETLMPLYDDLRINFINKIEFDYELVFVDDGSRDNSWSVLKKLASVDSKVKIIKLSRNFGSHAAMLCGLSYCTGDCVAVKAADLQEPTQLLIDMYDKWKKGNKVILATREEREDTSHFSNLYYWIVQKSSLKEMPNGGFDMYLIDRKVVDVLVNLDEVNSALTCQILWSGFKTTTVNYKRISREIGTSKWTLKKKIKLVADTLFSFSTLPITLITWVGIISCIISVLWAVFVLVGYMQGNIVVEGFTTLIIFNLFSLGIIMFTLGIIGNYIWRIFDSSRKRPVYIVDEDI